MTFSPLVARTSRSGDNKVLGTPSATAKVNGNAKIHSLLSQRTPSASFPPWAGRGEFGKLLGVSAQSIYNWESEKARPRAEQIAKLAALRSVGKREAAARLEQLNGAKG